MKPLPETIRITNAGWSEDQCAWKVQLGTENETIAYVWIGGHLAPSLKDYDRAYAAAVKICEGWNTPSHGETQ